MSNQFVANSESLGAGLPPLPAVPANVDFTTGTYKNADGLRLFTYRFALKGGSQPKGSVYLCHGYASQTIFEWFLPSEAGRSHDTWNGSVLQNLVDAGYVVHTLDQQAHGRSEGARGLRAYFDKFDDLAEESLDYIRDVVLQDATTKGAPLFVFGISMGGATAVRMVQMEAALFQGMVLYAPMLSLDHVKELPVICCIKNKNLVPISGCVSSLLPTLPVAKAAKNTVHPLSQKEFDDDPLNYHGDVRGRVAYEFNTLCSWYMDDGLDSVEVPFVTFHSVRDTFTDPAGSARLYERAVSSDKTYVQVGRGFDIDVDIWHSLPTEPGHELINQRATSWLLQRS